MTDRPLTETAIRAAACTAQRQITHLKGCHQFGVGGVLCTLDQAMRDIGVQDLFPPVVTPENYAKALFTIAVLTKKPNSKDKREGRE